MPESRGHWTSVSCHPQERQSQNGPAEQSRGKGHTQLLRSWLRTPCGQGPVSSGTAPPPGRRTAGTQAPGGRAGGGGAQSRPSAGRGAPRAGRRLPARGSPCPALWGSAAGACAHRPAPRPQRACRTSERGPGGASGPRTLRVSARAWRPGPRPCPPPPGRGPVRGGSRASRLRGPYPKTPPRGPRGPWAAAGLESASTRVGEGALQPGSPFS